MFPEQDLEIIEAIYVQCRKNKEATVEALLRMANPDQAQASVADDALAAQQLHMQQLQQQNLR